MDKIKIIISVILVLITSIIGYRYVTGSQHESVVSEPEPQIVSTDFAISSPVFKYGDEIPAKYTCEGEDISPPLTISNVPEKVKSLVLIIDDKDTPQGTWVHWLVWNIGPETKEIAEDTIPFGAVSGRTSFGENVYGGPCPPSGTHRYYFRLYALDTLMTLPQESGKQEVIDAINTHVIARTEYMGTYAR